MNCFQQKLSHCNLQMRLDIEGAGDNSPVLSCDPRSLLSPHNSDCSASALLCFSMHHFHTVFCLAKNKKNGGGQGMRLVSTHCSADYTCKDVKRSTTNCKSLYHSLSG